MVTSTSFLPAMPLTYLFQCFDVDHRSLSYAISKTVPNLQLLNCLRERFHKPVMNAGLYKDSIGTNTRLEAMKVQQIIIRPC